MRVNFRLCVLLFMFIRVERDWLEAFRRLRLINLGNLLLMRQPCISITKVETPIY
jgi:hypothetical protein